MSSFRSLNQTTSSNPNPAKRFLQWKSNDKCFSYYDKENQTNVAIQLPFKFQFLEHFHTVKGWHDATQKGIYSNEVVFTSKDELTVKTFGGLEIAKGLYSDIRSKIRDAGAKYHRSVYVLDDKGEIINLSLKGAVVSAYSDFLNGDNKVKGHSHLLESNWIEINSAQDLKKGATKYSVPIFTVGTAYTQSEFNLASEKYNELATYFKAYSGKEVAKEQVDAEPIDDFDDF